MIKYFHIQVKQNWQTRWGLMSAYHSSLESQKHPAYLWGVQSLLWGNGHSHCTLSYLTASCEDQVQRILLFLSWKWRKASHGFDHGNLPSHRQPASDIFIAEPLFLGVSANSLEPCRQASPCQWPMLGHSIMLCVCLSLNWDGNWPKGGE